MVKIRLTRVGAKRKPFYRLQAIDERDKRDGRALELLGTYNPHSNPATVDFDTEKIDAWVAAYGIETSGRSWSEWVSDPGSTPEAELVTRIYYPLS